MSPQFCMDHNSQVKDYTVVLLKFCNPQNHLTPAMFGRNDILACRINDNNNKNIIAIL